MTKSPSIGGGSTNYVYIRSDQHAWVPAKLLSTNGGGKASVSVPRYPNEQSMLSDGGKGSRRADDKVVELKDYPGKVLPLANVDGNGKLLEKEDMVELPFLHEAAILYNLKHRHIEEKPYTRTGDILMAVNPYKWFKNLYTEKKRMAYSRALVWENTGTGSDPRNDIEPHVYESSALCYRGLAVDRQDQSILVSGESGAGKTETVKICMNHIASVQRGPVKKGQTGEKFSSPIVEKVVDSNPLLEAFGNAKTRRNDNSSRFGKYLQLQFDTSESIMLGKTDQSISTCVLAGSKCEVYLLEKNRVVSHEEEERTFHIFYQLLAAPDSKKTKFWDGLKGANNESFKYVGRTNTHTIEGEKDGDKFQSTVDSLALVGVKGEKLNTLMRAICVVLQLGNITFGPQSGDHDKSVITSKQALKDLADITGISKDELTKALTERTVKVRNEECIVPQNEATAKESCDAFAKQIYGKTFLWLVRQINAATCASVHYKNGTMDKFGIIGLLDIFGFESFERNRFEQLCINYANEKLQQKFTQDVFRSVQAEYEAEGIDLADITYDDNTDVLDLIEGQTGLLAMLNEECVRPKGNDAAFVNKALAENKKSSCLIVNKMDRLSFGIKHYAGEVMYDAEGFVTSNADTLPTDLKECALKSSNDILVNEVGMDGVEAGTANGRAKPKRVASNIAAPTAWSKYKDQLKSLMVSIRKTQSRYIRCVKPNTLKKPEIMQHNLTVEQLRCAGVVAAVTVSRSAFPNRLENSVVSHRFATLWDKNKYKPKKKKSEDEQLRSDCNQLLTCALKEKETTENGVTIKPFVVGKTRTYFRAGALEYIEEARLRGLHAPATELQRFIRGWLVRFRIANPNRKPLPKKKPAKRRMSNSAELTAEAQKVLKEAGDKSKWNVKREKEYAEEEADLLKQLEELEEELAASKKKKTREIKEAQDNVERLKKENEEIRKKIKEEIRKAAVEPKKKIAAQQAKLDESVKLIKFLRKENKKLRERTTSLKSDYKNLEENKHRLLEANAFAGASVGFIEEQSKKQIENQEQISKNLDGFKKRNSCYSDDLAVRNAYYMAESSTCLEFEKGLASILEMMRKSCTQKDLLLTVEELAMSDEYFVKSDSGQNKPPIEYSETSYSDSSDED